MVRNLEYIARQIRAVNQVGLNCRADITCEEEAVVSVLEHGDDG